MDIINLLVNQAGQADTTRLQAPQGSEFADFGLLMRQVATGFNSALPAGIPAAEAALDAGNLRPLDAAELGGREGNSLPELAEALRDNLRRGGLAQVPENASPVLVEDQEEAEQAAATDSSNAPVTSPLVAPVPGTGTLAASPSEGAGRAAVDRQAVATNAFTRTADGAGNLPGTEGLILPTGRVVESTPAPVIRQASLSTAGSQASATDDLAHGNGALIPAPADASSSQLEQPGVRELAPWLNGVAGKSGSDAGAPTNLATAANPGLATDASPLSGSGMQAPGTGSLTGPAAQASLSQTLSSPGWPQQFSQQILHFAQRGDRQVELRLNPAELGPLSVTLRLDEHGAQAHFLSAHASVRAAVEQAIPQLRETLAEQGISLGEAEVGEQGFGRSSEQSSPENGRQGQAAGQMALQSEPDAATERAVMPGDAGLPGAVDAWA